MGSPYIDAKWRPKAPKQHSVDWPMLTFTISQPALPEDFVDASRLREGCMEQFFVTPRRMADYGQADDGQHLLVTYGVSLTGVKPVANVLTLNRLRAMIGFLKGAGPGYCGFVNVTAGSRADLFHGPCCRPLVPPHRQTPRQQPPSRHLAGALAGQFFDALLPLWRCLADPSIRTRLVPADSAGDAGGAEVHAGLRLEGWFYDAIGFESTVSCNVEAMAQAVWAVVTSRAAGQERDGREGADLLMGFSSPAGGGAPTLKALLVPRVLEFNSRRKKMLPRANAFGGFGALELSGMLSKSISEAMFGGLAAAAGTADMDALLRKAFGSATTAPL